MAYIYVYNYTDIYSYAVIVTEANVPLAVADV